MICLWVCRTGSTCFFPVSLQQISPCWEPGEWSKVYRLDLRDGTHVLLKGTPRSRNETLVAQCLHELSPACVPQVLIADLDPLQRRWFLMEDTGQCDMSTLAQSTALEVVRKLGCLFSTCWFSSLLPRSASLHAGEQLLFLLLNAPVPLTSIVLCPAHQFLRLWRTLPQPQYLLDKE
jgi:hypothetical protein